MTISNWLTVAAMIVPIVVGFLYAMHNARKSARESTDAITTTLKDGFTVLSGRVDALADSQKELARVTEKRLDAHASELREQGEDIATLKARVD